jgi:hypothetical protein
VEELVEMQTKTLAATTTMFGSVFLRRKEIRKIRWKEVEKKPNLISKVEREGKKQTFTPPAKGDPSGIANHINGGMTHRRRKSKKKEADEVGETAEKKVYGPTQTICEEGLEFFRSMREKTKGEEESE